VLSNPRARRRKRGLARALGGRGDLDPRTDPELLEDAAHVVGHRVLGDGELLGYFAVGQSPGSREGDLLLAGGERFGGFVGWPRLLWRGDEQGRFGLFIASINCGIYCFWLTALGLYTVYPRFFCERISAAATWQAALWSEASSSRAGTSFRQRGSWEPASPERRTEQRGWKRQPGNVCCGTTPQK
jgi:hypothetical protein